MKNTWYKYEVVTIDEPSVLATIVYNCPTKKEALEAVAAQIGKQEAKDMRGDLERMRVIKTKRNGEDYFFWGEQCDTCGQPNNGKWSYVAVF
jgi:hypothetical protein